MATINYKGLTGIIGSVTVDLATDTFDTLIAAIASDEGLPTEYYTVTLQRNPSIGDIVYGDSSTPLDDASIGIVDGDKVICTPNQRGSKEERQVQKLEIAAVKRAATSRPAVYDRDALPTKYVGNAVVDNPNEGGLVLGRPWTTGAVTALFVSLGAEFEIVVDDTSGISPGMIMTGADYSGTVTVVTVISSTSLEMSIIAPDTVPAPGTVLTFTTP
jgi:hypothetical protein